MQEITLANLSTKTAQEVFDYVKNHLLTQNEQSHIEIFNFSLNIDF